MDTNFEKMRAAAVAGDWATALKIASGFKALGADQKTVKRAHECRVWPDFYRQLGRDPEAMVQAGIDVLRRRYGIA